MVGGRFVWLVVTGRFAGMFVGVVGFVAVVVGEAAGTGTGEVGWRVGFDRQAGGEGRVVRSAGS